MSPQFFGFKLDSCPVPGSQQLCPPGMTWRDCPAHFDCYVPCNETVAFEWFAVASSPYNGQAYCEMFPRPPAFDISPRPPSLPSSPPLMPPASSPLPPSSPVSPLAPAAPRSPSYPPSLPPMTPSAPGSPWLNDTGYQFWAQVGKPTTFMPNYDNIYMVGFRV